MTIQRAKEILEENEYKIVEIGCGIFVMTCNEGETEVAVFDAYGKKVGTIVCGKMPTGKYLYSANFNLASGMYYTSVTNNGNLATYKTLIIK